MESAAEITVGAPDIPDFEIEVVVTASQINSALKEDMPAAVATIAEQQGWLLNTKATWGDLRTSLCDLEKAGYIPDAGLAISMDKPEEASDHLAKVTLTLSVTGYEPGKCKEGRLMATASMDFAPWTVEQASQIREQLNTDLEKLEDAIVQIRFEFKRAEFIRDENGQSVRANEVLEKFSLLLGDPTIVDDPETSRDESRFELVPFFLLDSITPQTPQRFELDPDSEVTATVRAQIIDPPSNPESMTLRVEAVIELKTSSLVSTKLEGSGVGLHLQPEIVINALKVITESL